MNLITETLTNQLHRQLTEFPFHNLNLLNGVTAPVGGTCFDHALKLKYSLQLDGFSAKLHEAEVCITGEMTHRLVKVEVDGSNIFLDTGTGWPTCYVIALDACEQSYEIAGVKFQIVPQKRHILVRRYNGDKWLDMNRIPVEEQDETGILGRFNGRYKQKLPFSNELRLCWLDGQKFYRIAGNQLLTYELGKCVEQNNITPLEILRRIEKTVFPELIPDLEKYLEKYS
ncbi:MAG: arylamine N-acetyltransferase [Gammaproteobacteria bacterium]